ncbi:hypothetical protein F0562_033101 [Nyssa sinensis]|uniref:Uncharacterized protein n=1 Tax=Nyssa sinensis TaxID=561372 RepID=A0A5J5AU43_9ASTE|nr:hypothetical protein F0562_033101 [Nyssa sinensis]
MDSVKILDSELIQRIPIAVILSEQENNSGSVAAGRELMVIPDQRELLADRKAHVMGEASGWVWRNFRKVFKILGMSRRGFEVDIIHLFSEIDNKRKQLRKAACGKNETAHAKAKTRVTESEMCTFQVLQIKSEDDYNTFMEENLNNLLRS